MNINKLLALADDMAHEKTVYISKAFLKSEFGIDCESTYYPVKILGINANDTVRLEYIDIMDCEEFEDVDVDEVYLEKQIIYMLSSIIKACIDDKKGDVYFDDEITVINNCVSHELFSICQSDYALFFKGDYFCSLEQLKIETLEEILKIIRK